MDIYYVYQYLREDGTPYYVGKGKKDRATSKNHRVPVPKDKSRIVYVATDLSEEAAHLLEKELIQQLGRKDLGTGILRNMTDGGEGRAGITEAERVKRQQHVKRMHTPDVIAKRSATRKQRQHKMDDDAIARRQSTRMANGGYESLSTDQHRCKLSEALKGKPKSEEHRRKMSDRMKGNKLSAETRAKLSANAGSSRKIAQYTTDWVLVVIHDQLQHAASAAGLCTKTIYEACRRDKPSGGFFWRYAD